MISVKHQKAKKRDFCRFSMMSKTIIFVLVQIQKVIFCKKRRLFCVYWISQFEGLSTLKILTTDSLGNVRAIEKVAMF